MHRPARSSQERDLGMSSLQMEENRPGKDEVISKEKGPRTEP